MISCCVRHRATCVSGRWETHTEELHELNLVGPVCITECPQCKVELKMQRDFLQRSYQNAEKKTSYGYPPSTLKTP